MGKEEKFEYFRKPENTERYSCFVILSEHSGKLLESMRADNAVIPGSAAEKELIFKSSALSRMGSSLDFIIDGERYSASMASAPPRTDLTPPHRSTG